jgi:hypothetical protein
VKIRFKGREPVKDPRTGKLEPNRLDQLFEDALYSFPEPGSVMSVPDGVAGWLMWKHAKLLEAVAEKGPKAPMAAPTVYTAIVPRDEPAQPEKK